MLAHRHATVQLQTLPYRDTKLWYTLDDHATYRVVFSGTILALGIKRNHRRIVALVADGAFVLVVHHRDPASLDLVRVIWVDRCHHSVRRTIPDGDTAMVGGSCESV